MKRNISLNVVTKPTGYILYDGPSVFDKKRVVVIATGFGFSSENEKTGKVIQTWILVGDQAPIEAHHAGNDSTVCSSCKHRHFRSCYVNLTRGPENVYKSWRQGKYPTVPSPEVFRDYTVRLGAYGDPAAVPVSVWDMVTERCKSHLGYTHQWKRAPVGLREYCMASCDTIEEAEDAKSRGWRPFLVRQTGEALPPGYFACPASKEAGKRLTCAECRVCKGGTHRHGKGLPSLIAHGPSWKRVYFERGMALMKNHEKYVGVFAKKS